MSTIRQFSRILVAIDQSENSAKAFDYAIQLAEYLVARFLLYFAIKIPMATYGHFL
jgi:nucleotide-binding universal stress UspA family protein